MAGFSLGELTLIVDMVVRDTSRLSITRPQLILFDGRTAVGTADGADRLGAGNIGDRGDLFATWGTHWMRIVASTPVTAAAELLWHIQDDVIDELGRGWPELRSPEGRFAGVLFVRAATNDADCGWFLADMKCCDIGQLAATVGDQIRW